MASERAVAKAATTGDSAIPSAAFMLLALMTVFWGINFPVMKLALAEIEPWTFRVICLGSGAIGLFAIAKIAGQDLAVPRRDWPMLVLPEVVPTDEKHRKALGDAAEEAQPLAVAQEDRGQVQFREVAVEQR